MTFTGVGLVTGLGFEATLALSPTPGIRFLCQLSPGLRVEIPASLQAVVDTRRGVTLAAALPVEAAADSTQPQRVTLSIVEHFLGACALAGVMPESEGLTVTVRRQQPDDDVPLPLRGVFELPILDGSGQAWREALDALLGPRPAAHRLPALSGGSPHLLLPTRALRVADVQGEGCITLLPKKAGFALRYAVDFPHPLLHARHACWTPGQDNAEDVAGARTFGFVSELPALQARGLARGVRPDNTIGLTDEGGTTIPLRHPDELIHHKMLDFLGDAMLSGMNPLQLAAEVTVVRGGHTLHIALAALLQRVAVP